MHCSSALKAQCNGTVRSSSTKMSFEVFRMTALRFAPSEAWPSSLHCLPFVLECPCMSCFLLKAMVFALGLSDRYSSCQAKPLNL